MGGSEVAPPQAIDEPLFHPDDHLQPLRPRQTAHTRDLPWVTLRAERDGVRLCEFIPGGVDVGDGVNNDRPVAAAHHEGDVRIEFCVLLDGPAAVERLDAAVAARGELCCEKRGKRGRGGEIQGDKGRYREIQGETGRLIQGQERFARKRVRNGSANVSMCERAFITTGGPPEGNQRDIPRVPARVTNRRAYRAYRAYRACCA